VGPGSESRLQPAGRNLFKRALKSDACCPGQRPTAWRRDSELRALRLGIARDPGLGAPASAGRA